MMITRKQKRRGAATAEVAVCLPILVILIVGINETCSAVFLKEQVTIAAYEGARVGVQKQATDELVEQRVRQFLDERGIVYDEGVVVQISTPGFNDSPTMGHVTTTVTVPVADNCLTGGFFTTQLVSGSVTMRKEYQNN